MKVEVQCQECGELVPVRWYQSTWTAWARHQETADHPPPVVLCVRIDGQTLDDLLAFNRYLDRVAVQRGLKCATCGEEGTRRFLRKHLCKPGGRLVA